MINDPRFEQIKSHYGERHQQIKLIEECGELLTELGRFANKERVNVAGLVRECADVIVLIRQLYPNTKGFRFAENVVTPVFTSNLLGNLVSKTAHNQMCANNGLPRDSSISELAETTVNAIFAFVKDIDELPMLHSAIDIKLERQIERIKLEKSTNGN